MTDATEDSPPVSSGPIYDPGNPDHIAVATRQDARHKDRRLDDLAWVLDDERGRRFVYHILELSQLYQEGSMDPVVFQRQEGARNLGRQIQHLLQQIDPVMYARLILERVELLKRDEAERTLALSQPAV